MKRRFMQQNCYGKIFRLVAPKEAQLAFEVGSPLDFGQDFAPQTRIFEQPHSVSGFSFGENADQFLPDAFLADLVNRGRHFTNGSPGRRFDPITEARAKADSAQNSQLVFFEALTRIADGADEFLLDILLTIDEIENLFCQW